MKSRAEALEALWTSMNAWRGSFSPTMASVACSEALAELIAVCEHEAAAPFRDADLYPSNRETELTSRLMRLELENHGLRKKVADWGSVVGMFTFTDGRTAPLCPRPAYGEHYLGQLRNRCALCGAVARMLDDHHTFGMSKLAAENAAAVQKLAEPCLGSLTAGDLRSIYEVWSSGPNRTSNFALWGLLKRALEKGKKS